MSDHLSRSELALQQIRVMLDAHAHLPRWRLAPERQLAAQVGTGRRAVRRALDVLEAEGRLWRRQGKGTFAGHQPGTRSGAALSLAERTSPLDMMQARLEVEPGLARLAAANATGAVVAQLGHILQRLGSSTDAESIERWDAAFHRTIAETAGNALLLTLFGVMDQVRELPAWQKPRAQARTGDRLRAAQRQHAAIVDALARHDGMEAERAMRQHLLSLQSNLRQALLGESASA